MYENDQRTVLTLDAGGTNFVFSAIRGGEEVVEPVRMDAVTDDVQRCLEVLVEGFDRVQSLLDTPAVAISFAFPGPADYENGIIGDLPNFPCFKDGVAMGPYLEDVFGLPVRRPEARSGTITSWASRSEPVSAAASSWTDGSCAGTTAAAAMSG